MTADHVEEVVALGESDDVVGAAIEAVPLAMVLTDPRLEDNPITFVNRAFEEITLYGRAFAVGRNCRFLQGEDTDPADVARIRDAVAAGEDVSLDLVNHKADGTPFLNRLLVSPIRNEAEEIVAFVGVQRELTEPGEAERATFRSARSRPAEDTMLQEVQHRVKNHLAMLVGLIRMQAAKEVSRKSFEDLSHRVRTLALLYDELSGSGLASGGSDTVDAGAYLNRIVTSLAAIEGRGSVRVNVECDGVEMPVDLSARLGLISTEFVTNALQHAFGEADAGIVRVRFQRLTGGGARLTVEDDGRGLPEGSSWPWTEEAEQGDNSKAFSSGIGGNIVVALARDLDGTLAVRSSGTGTIVTLDVPVADGPVAEGPVADGPADDEAIEGTPAP